MKRQDLVDLKVACMNAQVNEYNWYRPVGGAAKVAVKVVYHGTTFDFVVEADKVDEAKENAFQVLKKRFSCRMTSTWSRKVLDAPGLESQRHLLFWKTHMDLYEAIKTYSELCALIPRHPGNWATKKEIVAYDKANYDAWIFFRRHGLNVTDGYKIKELLWQYNQVPVSWIRAYQAGKAA